MGIQSVRQRKVAERIQQLVSTVIDRKVKDPDTGFVTITHVRVSPDLRIASIYFTTLGNQEATQRSLEALNRANNFIRNEIAAHLKMRFVPELRFFIDDTLEYARKIEKILDDIKKGDDEK
jgi:ribosome-binding factor A